MALNPQNIFAPFIEGQGLFLSVSPGAIIFGGATIVVPFTIISLFGNATNYVYLDTSLGEVDVSSSGWPTSDFYPVAIVITGHDYVISMVDKRPDLFSASDTAGNVPVPSNRHINTTLPLTGGGDLSADRTFAINNFTGDNGAGGLRGAVPAPGAGDGVHKFLKADGTWVQVSLSDLSSGAVPTSRLINTTLPLTGGGDLSADRTLAINNFTGDAGAGGLKGAVPAPGAGDGTNKFLKADGTWQQVSVSDVSSGVPATRAINTTLPLTGGGNLSADRTLAINNFTGDAGAGGLKGAVPAPSAGDGLHKFLKADGTWALVGAADVTGIPPSTRAINTTLPLTGGGDLSADRTLAINNFTGDSGAGGLKGTVPAPAAGDTAAKKYLFADGTWRTILGTDISSGTTPYDVVISIPGKPADAYLFLIEIFTRTVVFSADWAGARGKVLTNPGGTITFTIKKNGSTVGTAVIDNTGAYTFATSGHTTVTFNAGDYMTVLCPTPQEGTLADISWTLPGLR